MTGNDVVGDEVHRFGLAWVLLCVALALHVLDEALMDFLSVYNPSVLAIRRRFPFLPLPVFSFRVWLTGLCVAISIAFALSPLAYRGSHFVIAAAFPLSILMCANALSHIGASLYRWRLMPGVYSSPILLLASVYLFICAEKALHVLRGSVLEILAFAL
jgi:hypothetical protein